MEQICHSFSKLIKRIADMYTQKQRNLTCAEASNPGPSCFLYTSFTLIGNKIGPEASREKLTEVLTWTWWTAAPKRAYLVAGSRLAASSRSSINLVAPPPPAEIAVDFSYFSRSLSQVHKIEVFLGSISLP